MYYRKALELETFRYMAEDEGNYVYNVFLYTNL